MIPSITVLTLQSLIFFTQHATVTTSTNPLRMSFSATPLGQSRRLDHNTFLNKQPSEDPALVRYAKIKSQQQRLATNPENWAVRDTSVNVANAFSAAAAAASATYQQEQQENMPISTATAAWASGSKTKQVPRSTSVEYEQAQAATTSNRSRLAPPPARSAAAARGLQASKSHLTVVPDSEDEDISINESMSRGKSPFDKAKEYATYFMKPRNSLRDQANNSVSSHDNSTSYDYSAEERIYQQTRSMPDIPESTAEPAPEPMPMPTASANLSSSSSHRRRKSIDNRAYLPSSSDEDEDRVGSDTGRKWKPPKGGASSKLTNLPTVLDGLKKKKKRSSGGGRRRNTSVDEALASDSSEQHAAHQRVNAVPPKPIHHVEDDRLLLEDDFDVGIDDIPVDPSPPRALQRVEKRLSEDSHTGSPSWEFSIGAFLGRMVHVFYMLISSILFGLWYYSGRSLGALLRQQWFRVLALSSAVLVVGWLASKTSLVPSTKEDWSKIVPKPSSMPTWPVASLVSSNPQFKDNTEITKRLRSLERVASRLEGFIADMDKRVQSNTDQLLHPKPHVFPTGLEEKLARFDAHIRDTALRNQKDDTTSRAIESSLKEIRDEVLALTGTQSSLKKHIGGLEAGLNAGKTKAGSLKTSDSQDVSRLLNKLVHTALLSAGGPSRVDYALYSSGGRVVPKLTSPTFSIPPSNRFVAFITGAQKAEGRPPVVALHHERSAGHCWPFAGTSGQLGVALASPVRVDSITIDHIPQELAMDMRTTPRECEVWSIVEGDDNLARLKAMYEANPDPESPKDTLYRKSLPALPRGQQYVRIASFTYDARRVGESVQTFPVFDYIRESGIDFGVTILRVKSNWGPAPYTCLYRFRVHGERLIEPPPLWEDTEEEDEQS